MSASATPAPAPAAPGMSAAARLLNVFFAPSKTFTDLKTGAGSFGWFAPWVVLAVFSLAFGVVVQQKVGFRRMTENALRMVPASVVEQIDKLPQDEREQKMRQFDIRNEAITYGWPVVRLLGLLLVAAVLMGTFNFGVGAEVPFGTSLAVVMYASLPELVRAAFGIVTLLAGADPTSFNIQNPVATNPAFFLDPANGRVLYGLAVSLDVINIWVLVLTAIGFACVSKMKRSTTLAVVFGWYVLLTLIQAGISAIFS